METQMLRDPSAFVAESHWMELVEAFCLGGHYRTEVVEGLNYLWQQGRLVELAECLAEFLYRLTDAGPYLSPYCSCEEQEKATSEHRSDVRRKIAGLVSQVTTGRIRRESWATSVDDLVEVYHLIEACEQPEADLDTLQKLADFSDFLVEFAETMAANLGSLSDAESDRLSVGWELSKQNKSPAATRYQSRKIVADGRHLDRSTKSVEVSNGAVRVEFDVRDLFSCGADPARIGAFRVDHDSWLASLPKNWRDAAHLMTFGFSAVEIGERLGLSDRYVREVRKMVGDSFLKYHGRTISGKNSESPIF